MLTLLAGPVMVAAWAVVGWVGWSRVHLRAHTVAQVVTGGVAGAAVAAAVYLAVV